MNEPTNATSAGKWRGLPGGPRWLWPPRRFTLVVVGCTVALAFFACFPAIEAPHANLRDETFGLHFNLLTEYEHGWPVRYSRRDLAHRTAAEGPPSAWRPWDGPGRWSTSGLLADLVFWGLVIVLSGVGAQWWQSQRAVWQLGLRDLLIFTGIAGLAFAWLADQRVEYLRERALVAQLRMRPGHATQEHQVGSRVGAWWPKSWQAHCRELFDRPCYFYSSGDTDIACQHRHVVALRELTFHPEFPEHLRKMQRLEAIDLCFVELPYFDATRQATVLRDLAPLPNLRGINLCKTNATDADTAWLASCPRLEVIELSQSDIGDRGLAQLVKLPRLRRLSVSSDRISDRGCQSIGQMQSLEELSLASRNIHDAGAHELAKLPRLKRLQISASTTDAAHDALRRALPNCELKGSHYPNARGPSP